MRFRYKPVISFDRRKAALLDWVETHLEPSSFRDAEDEVGVSLKRGARIRIDRQSVVLENTGALADGFDSLAPMLDGLMETMEPKDIAFVDGGFCWTGEFPETTYAHATAQLARSATGIGDLPCGLVPSDVATLVDLRGENFELQAEYGVVTPHELSLRLSGADAGRLNGRPRAQLRPKALDNLSPVLLFVDTYVHNVRRSVIIGQAGIQDAAAAFESDAREVAEAIVAAALMKESTK